MTGPEGKLFKPLAFTKTFCLIGSVIVALTVIPAAAHILFSGEGPVEDDETPVAVPGLSPPACWLGLWLHWWWAGALLVVVGAYLLAADHLPARVRTDHAVAGQRRW